MPNDFTAAGETTVHAPPPLRVDVAGQELTLFEESGPLIAAMIADIETATSRVWLETYIFADDSAGDAVATALAARARAGLDVRLMIDAWGSFNMPRSTLSRLRASGVKVHVFHDFAAAWRRPLKFLQLLNQRNHRKLLVVDDRIAYFGGMNIVDQSGIHSKGDAKERQLPASAGWRDVHVRLVGPEQAEVADSMLRLWNRVHHEKPSRRPRWPIEEALDDSHESIFFFDSRPTLKKRRPHRIFVPLLRSARREITLAVAYFVPFGAYLGELLAARRRGVLVRVIVPGQSDVRVVQWATRHVYEYLLKRGFRIFERRDQMLHSKVMTIDGRSSIVGSCNLDARSMRLNLEFFAVIHSPAVALALAEICRREVRASVRVTPASCRRRSWWQRLLNRTAWSMRRWL